MLDTSYCNRYDQYNVVLYVYHDRKKKLIPVGVLNFYVMSKTNAKKTKKDKQTEAQLKAAKNSGFDSLEHFKKAAGANEDKPKKNREK